MGFGQAVERVKNQRYLYRRGDAFVFRRGVPAAYRKAFGKTEVRKTLNARTAARKAIRETGKTHRGKASLGRPLAADPTEVRDWRSKTGASIRRTMAKFEISKSTVERYCALK